MITMASPHRLNKVLLQLLVVLIFSAQLFSPAAEAKQGGKVIKTISVSQLEALMKKNGFAVSIDDDGDILWMVEGYRTSLMISDDKENILFQSSFQDTSATLETVNNWNRSKRYSRTYLDDENDPILESDLDLEGGVTHAHVINFIRTCRTSFEAWLNEVID